MRGCGASCGHRQIVTAYREERQRLEMQAEDKSLGYATELRDWLRDNPIGTFKDYLIQTKRAPMGPHSDVSPIPVAPATSFLQSQSIAEASEAALLGCAMASDKAIPALKALDVSREFRHPFHAHVAQAILDLSERGLPHDAAKVTDLLRERKVLPVGYDPAVPLRTVDPAQYGLGAWESVALPPQAAPSFAMEIRTSYRAHYLEDLCVRGASYARALGESENGLSGIDLIGEARTRVANELINFPPELGPDLQPAKATSSQPVDTDIPIRQATALRTTALHMPPRPQLSAVSTAVLSHRSG